MYGPIQLAPGPLYGRLRGWCGGYGGAGRLGLNFSYQVMVLDELVLPVKRCERELDHH